ncbi:MAG: hypothetical protein HKN09_02540 [Saprospiraceae bacterium]|nr:hypothetical protein [Saprospiraceae bacterium]
MKILKLTFLCTLFICSFNLNAQIDLDITKGIKIGNSSTTEAGTIRFNDATNTFEGYNGSEWMSLDAVGGSSNVWVDSTGYIYRLDSRVGIGTNDPDSSSILEISSTTQGMLMPRMTTIQRDSIVNPAKGLTIFNLDDCCTDVYDGMGWLKLCPQVSKVDTLDMGSWLQKNSLPNDTLYGAFSAVVNDRIFMITGRNNSVHTKNVLEYLQESDTWSSLTPFPGSERSGGVGFVLNGKIYFGLGYNTGWLSDFWEFDPVTDIWTQKSNVPGSGRQYTAQFALNGKGYLVCGHGEINQFSKEVWEYDPMTDMWTQKSDFPGIGRQGPFGFELNNKGYIGGGIFPPLNFLKDFWEYDPMTDIWTQKNDLINEVSAANSFKINNVPYITSGLINIGNSLTVVNETWRYDSVNDAWEADVDFPGNGRYYSSTFSRNGLAYLVGGVDGINGTLFNEVWEFSPVRLSQTLNKNSKVAHLYSDTINNGIWQKHGNIVSIVEEGGKIRLEDGSADGHLMKSDSSGMMCWTDPGTYDEWDNIGNNLNYNHGSVGIHADSPTGLFEIGESCNSNPSFQNQTQTTGTLVDNNTSSWQSVTFDTTGCLKKYDWYFDLVFSGEIIEFKIYKGEGTSGELLYSTVKTIGNTGFDSWKSFNNILLNVEKDSTYTFYIFKIGGSQNTQIEYSDSDPYLGGLSSVGVFADFRFRAHVSANSGTLLVVEEVGNLGIGTNSPSQKLDVDGNIRMRNGALSGYLPVSDADGVMTWTDPNTITAAPQDLHLSGNTLSLSGDATTVDLSTYMDNTDAQDLSLSGTILSLSGDATTVDLSAYDDWTNSGNDIYFDNEHVAIKTSNTTYGTFAIEDTSKTTLVLRTPDNTKPAGISFMNQGINYNWTIYGTASTFNFAYGGGSDPESSTDYFNFSSTGARITVENGATLNNAGVWTDASDRSRKYNIQDLNYGLSEVMSMRPSYYKMKSDDSNAIGFIAQDMKEIIPEVVYGEDGNLSMGYGQLTAVLVNAIKEQQALIDQLTKNNASLKAENKALDARMNKIEALLSGTVEE